MILEKVNFGVRKIGWLSLKNIFFYKVQQLEMKI